MSIFSRLFRKENIASKRYRLEYARKLDGKLLRYVTERLESGEVVVGKDGHITVKEDVLRIYCGAEPVFSCGCEELLAAELMSHDGVMVEGLDGVSGCQRKLVAHYKYYRK